MCKGFGIIVDRELNLWFSEPDMESDCSHTQTIDRLGWKENQDLNLRHFVRVEFEDWTPASFKFDEVSSLPGWSEAEKDIIHERCIELLGRCAPAKAEYEKVRAPAYAEYEKVRAPAYAEYGKVCAPAYAEYEKVRDQAKAEYEKVCAPAKAEYEKVRDQAKAEYEKVRDQAHEHMVQTLSTIPGYV